MSSERINVRLMSAQEKADFTYGKVRQKYQQVVADAERARENRDWEKVTALFLKFANRDIQESLEKGLERRREQGADVSGHQETIDLAMAGFFRIEHVSKNSQAARSRGKQKDAYLLEAELMQGRYSEPVPTRRTLANTFYSIHGDPIYWEGELTQDALRTKVLKKDPDIVDYAKDSVGKMQELVEEIQRTHDFWYINEDLTQRVAGIYSSMGMVCVQMGRANRDASAMNLGLDFLQESDSLSRNQQRLKVAARWTVGVALPFHLKTAAKAAAIYWENM